ncbi:sigma-70 family RNA polymerase sigma factor [Streptomyces sp. CA-135486]|uniref:sigma-70 family RNA polymerase sigma factor n=1 Tax=Streptomyces sp. CA-135486 TaxID=3240049 RepID=UPI003D91CD41
MTRTQVTDETIQAAQAGDSDAMWQIVSAYEGVIRHAVRTVAPGACQDDAEDLLQEARAVLIQHVRDYNTSSSSASLSTFAHHAVRRAIAEAWVKSTTGLTVEPSSALRVKRALWDTEGDIEGAWMIVSSDVEPRRRMSRELFLATVEALADVESLEAPLRHDDDVTATLADTIPDASSDFTDPTERRDLARYLLREIPQRQSYALRAFYGIAMTQATDQEVAADLEIKLAALRKLRSNGIKSARAVAASHSLAA